MDKYITSVISNNINMTVPFYLMASYAYYEQDDPIISDHLFDKLAKKLLNNWDEIDHYHKYLLSKDVLEAGSYMGEYPSIVAGALESLRKGVKK